MDVICTQCAQLKTDSDFYKNGAGKLILICKSCIKKNNSEYYEKNKDFVLERIIKYQQVNKQKIKVRKKKYYQDNRELKIKQQTKYRAKNLRAFYERHKSDPKYRIRHTLSLSILRSLKKNNSNKSGKSIIKYLFFSIQELKEHLESQFEPWMNWDNYGVYRKLVWDDNDQSTWTWNIDHIIPHSTFRYTSMEDDDFKKCWALDNLRPLSAKQNNIDGTNKFRH